MLESAIEKKIKSHVESYGGRCLKFTSPGMRGVPDRICLFPGQKIIFVEVKAPGETPEPLQIKRHKELRELGFTVLVIDSEEQIGEVVPK